jgi:hypothetical protein
VHGSLSLLGLTPTRLRRAQPEPRGHPYARAHRQHAWRTHQQLQDPDTVLHRAALSGSSGNSTAPAYYENIVLLPCRRGCGLAIVERSRRAAHGRLSRLTQEYQVGSARAPGREAGARGKGGSDRQRRRALPAPPAEPPVLTYALGGPISWRLAPAYARSLHGGARLIIVRRAARRTPRPLPDYPFTTQTPVISR